jgi:signal peptidase I
MKNNKHLLASLLILILLILGRIFIWDFYMVDGSSMCPSLNQFKKQCYKGKKQILLVDKLTSELSRYDIVVFKHPEESEKLIKRVIGLPGEVVLIQDNNAFLQSSNSLVNLKYNSVYAEFDFANDFKEFRIPESELLLLGDNRSISIDSRNCFNFASRKCYRSQSNFLPTDNVIGKAIFSILPLKGI